jgi:isocitrate dehydrogenase
MAPSATITATNGTTGIAAPGRQFYRIALIPGDGIGIEVIQAGKIVLEKLAKCIDTFDLSFEDFEWSSEYYKKHGKYLPDDALDQVRKFNAILFGAVGAPGTSLLMFICPSPKKHTFQKNYIKKRRRKKKGEGYFFI